MKHETTTLNTKKNNSGFSQKIHGEKAAFKNNCK